MGVLLALQVVECYYLAFQAKAAGPLANYPHVAYPHAPAHLIADD